MGKKYLSIEEAASLLGMSAKELNVLRERGEIRAFADRGTWKFRQDDLDELQRSRQADSNPDVQMGDYADPGPDPFDTIDFDRGGSSSGRDAEIDLGSEDSVLGEQPTVIRRDPLGSKASDSDVRLVFDDNLMGGSSHEMPVINLGDSDSDVRLTGGATSPTSKGSDSDVRMVGSDFDAGSDSDVKLVPGSEKVSSSDVAVFDPDAAYASDESGGSFVLGGEDSGIALGSPSDSGISLDAPDSAVSLGPSDSGITLDIDSGVSLAGDSGIALAGPSDSGITLEVSNKKQDDDDLGGTIPMMNTPAEPDIFGETQMEVPLLGGEEDTFEFQSNQSLDVDDTATNVIMLEDEDAGDDHGQTMVKKKKGSDDDDVLDDSVFNVEDDDDVLGGSSGDDDLEVTDDVIGEDDEIEEADDVFGTDDEDFEEEEDDIAPAGYPSQRGMPAPVEQEWGTATFAGLALTSVFMLLTGWVMYDVVRTMWNGNDPSGPSAALLDMVKSLFG